MTDERYHHGWADARGVAQAWMLIPGEMIQRAGFAYEARVPAQQPGLETKLGIMLTGAPGTMALLQRVSFADMRAARDNAAVPICGQPMVWAATEDTRVVFVWPAPDKRYAAAWL